MLLLLLLFLLLLVVVVVVVSVIVVAFAVNGVCRQILFAFVRVDFRLGLRTLRERSLSRAVFPQGRCEKPRRRLANTFYLRELLREAVALPAPGLLDGA